MFLVNVRIGRVLTGHYSGGRRSEVRIVGVHCKNFMWYRASRADTIRGKDDIRATAARLRLDFLTWVPAKVEQRLRLLLYLYKHANVMGRGRLMKEPEEESRPPMRKPASRYTNEEVS